MEEQSVIHPVMCVLTSNIAVYILSKLFHRHEEQIVNNRFVDYSVFIALTSCMMVSCSDILGSALRTNPIAAAGGVAVTAATFCLTVHFIVEDSLTIDTYFTLGRLILSLLNVGCMLIITSAFSSSLLVFVALNAVILEYYGGETGDLRLQTEGHAGMMLILAYCCFMYPCVDIVYVYIIHLAKCVLLLSHQVPPIWSPLILAALGMKALSISLKLHIITVDPETLEVSLVQHQTIMQNVSRC